MEPVGGDGVTPPVGVPDCDRDSVLDEVRVVDVVKVNEEVCVVVALAEGEPLDEALTVSSPVPLVVGVWERVPLRVWLRLWLCDCGVGVDVSVSVRVATGVSVRVGLKLRLVLGLRDRVGVPVGTVETEPDRLTVTEVEPLPLTVLVGTKVRDGVPVGDHVELSVEVGVRVYGRVWLVVRLSDTERLLLAVRVRLRLGLGVTRWVGVWETVSVSVTGTVRVVREAVPRLRDSDHWAVDDWLQVPERVHVEVGSTVQDPLVLADRVTVRERERVWVVL
mmetsp:Transcript_11715/g.21212  ORF Transcript_11715/g.21212 Transcript_11715/m.21212 type:complete len:277 (+) Transcript_11715:1497-2327(+)